MISLSMASLLGTDVGQAPGDDQLQADVMRFMAIIGFCLVAIFAVVQSIPLNKPPAIEDDSRRQQALVLRQQLTQLAAERQQAVADIADLSLQAQQLQQQIVTEQRLLARLRGELADLQQQKQAAMAQARSEPVAEDAIRQPLMPAPVAKTEQPVAEGTAEPISEGAAAPGSPGFSLTVASDPVLLSLLQQQRLTLYVLAQGRARHIAPAGGVFRVVDADLPTRYHEMRRSTVPPVLRTLVRQHLSAADPDTLIWALVLPGDMQRQLQRLMASHDSGQLVIGPRGRIRHHAAPPPADTGASQ